MYIGSAMTWFLYDCMLCFYHGDFLHVCFTIMFAHMYVFIWYQTCKLSEHSKIKIPIHTFEKWHNVSYRCVSYVKSEISDIWRTSALFGERVEENHIYDLVKPNSTVKTRIIYRGCNYVTKFFWKRGKTHFKSKIRNFNLS